LRLNNLDVSSNIMIYQDLTHLLLFGPFEGPWGAYEGPWEAVSEPRLTIINFYI
jgi:hypothetical protein